MPPAAPAGCRRAKGLGEPALASGSAVAGDGEGERGGAKDRLAELSLRAKGDGRAGLTMERDSGESANGEAPPPPRGGESKDAFGASGEAACAS